MPRIRFEDVFATRPLGKLGTGSKNMGKMLLVGLGGEEMRQEFRKLQGEKEDERRRTIKGERRTKEEERREKERRRTKNVY